MVSLIGIGGAMIANYGYLETVPYTNRSHFVFRSPLEEREHAESRIAYLKEKYAPAILDQHHPHTVRVNRIASKLIHAVHRDLVTKRHDTVTLHSDNVGSAMEVFSRTMWKERRKQPQTRHLDGLNWEVIVIKDNHIDMWSLPAGKIIVPTGLLKFYKTDAELASVIAHEIGHIVARHWAEKIIYDKWLPRPLKLPFCRRAETEADLIGMMLLGSAGFDPRIAPLAIEKLGDSNRGFLCTHPSNKKRSQLLSETEIMEEALKLYREVNPHQNTERSLQVKF
ncbi:mitochondrial metalloendopeptidase OMA1 [Brachypodium distachyon]|uniref:mitochondrial metalloendopeptidase OMA1 n=1 Tax=Brachypodium distachyon TaxID=15368 RepID=UPI00052FE05E|nr:mitochondrial metalloendopeptidase OMA1 [Brachypodium distachyon]|eukprot:XP_010227367.1 mitochondrial metalloendopeptidase OMA1 [Brachypodium distachyon]